MVHGVVEDSTVTVVDAGVELGGIVDVGGTVVRGVVSPVVLVLGVVVARVVEVDTGVGTIHSSTHIWVCSSNIGLSSGHMG